MITIIFGPPRIGKTMLMVYLLTEAAFNRERNRKMRKALEEKNRNGFNLTIPDYAVSANFDITFRKYGYSQRKARIIDPNKIGFGGGGRNTHFLLPYETIGVMEAQEFYNSRNYAKFESWQSNLFEQHGHNHLDFYMDTQRPGLIDLNIRELAQFVEVRALDLKKDKYNHVSGLTWTVRTFDNCGLVDDYMRSGKKDRTCFKQFKITSDIDVRKSYDSWSLEPKFYMGHMEEDFDLRYQKKYGETKADYIQYLEDIGEVA